MMGDNLRLSLIDEIAKSSGYDIALITSFNYDISFFERAVLNQLSAQNIKKVTVFVDATELDKALSNVSSCNIGRRYLINPVNIKGAFHPKLILLLGEDKAKLFIGSGNITQSGMTTNNEIFNVIHYSQQNQRYLDIINAAISFFLEINSLSYQLDNDLFDEITQLSYYHRTNANGEIGFIHNLSTPLLDQIKERIEEPINEIRIAVPYYDNTLTALYNIAVSFPTAKTILYIQNGKSSFPLEVYDSSDASKQALVFEGFSDSQSNGYNNFYHGKVFLFKSASTAYIVYGSANCTQAALTKTYESSGNIECDLIGIGRPDEFDYFFEAFDIQEGVELKTHVLHYDTERSSAIYYKFGEIIGDTIVLHFGFPNDKCPEVTLAGEKLLCDIRSNELIATVPAELALDLTEVFDVQIKTDDHKETLRCWAYNPEVLKDYRQRQSDKYSLESFENESEGDKYIQDRINLMNAETMCLPEIQEHKRKIAYLNQIRQEQEENDSVNDDFIIDIEILDDYKKSYRQINLVERIRGTFFNRLTYNAASLFSYARRDNIQKESHEGNHHNITRTASSEEKRFERFVKSRARGLTNKEYIEIINPEHFLGIVSVLLDIFNKYHDIDIFDTEYVIETRNNLFTALLLREEWEDDDSDFNEMLLRNCFYILMDNYVCSFGTDNMEQKDYLDSLNKKLLLAMEKRYSIRSSYKAILDAMYKTESEELQDIKPNNFYNYIEKLFGYKNYDLLVQLIEEYYADVKVDISDERMYIKGKAEDIRKELKPNEVLLKEIGSYSRAVSPIKSVSMTIVPKTVGQNGSKIIEIEHIVNYVLHNWRQTTVYADGTRWSEKPEYINV